MKKILIPLLALITIAPVHAQVISTTSAAAVTVTAGATISGGSINSYGKILNSGVISLSSNLTNGGSINGNGNYTLAGNWTNSGSFAAGTGTVSFNGSSLQTIGGNNSTRFSNVSIIGTGNVSLATNGSFTGVLTLNNSGSLTGAATDTLISTAAATARVAQVTGTGTITTNFVVQRYDNRTVAQYQSLSSAVQSATVGDWNISNRSPKFYMSGVGGPDGNAGSYVSVKLYNEHTNNYDNITAYTTPGINYTIKQGQGMYLWMGNSMSSMAAFTYITHGVPTVGNVSYPVTYTSGKGYGFNIIGNPYPSPISWTSFLTNNPTVQTTYYIFEQDGSWHTFTSGNIPMGQGFGIVTSSNTTLAFKESHKSSIDASLLRSGNPEQEDDAVTFTLSDNANALSCPTVVSFGNNYSNDYNPNEDAVYIKSYVAEAPQLYTTATDNKNMALNRLPDTSNHIDVPLATFENVAADYTLTISNAAKLSSYNCVLLIDKASGKVLNNFLQSQFYTFGSADTSSEKDFILRFSKITTGENCSTSGDNNSTVQIYKSNKNAIVNFNFSVPQNVVISVFNMLGEKVSNDLNYTVSTDKVTVPLPAINGMYIVRVYYSGWSVNQKLVVTE